MTAFVTRGSRMRVLLIFWVLLLLVLSLSPLAVKARLHTIGRFHYSGHFFVFALTAAAVLWNTSPLRSQIWRSGMVVLLGVVLEAAEAIVYHGRLEKRDLLVDTAGVAAGFLTMWAVSRFRLLPPVSVEMHPADRNGRS
jgi:hypothetical protein